ncbi:MAG: NAD-binding protein [Deltaproteobacteria bacterium]|nr:NAD-binding protein [Deltaproteobacteria bacterium]MBN2670060.1 NAD-binding protein [Deltaproteobacteria bacterium]
MKRTDAIKPEQSVREANKEKGAFSFLRTRLALLLCSVPVLLCFFAFLYMLGMTHLEHNPRDFASSLAWAAETFTTTGYGGDHHWNHPIMVGFVILVQFAGVFLVFLLFPILLMPYFEQRFEGRLPTVLPKLAGHIVIYSYGPAVETFLRQLEHNRVPFVIYEENEATARRLQERGRRVVFGCLADDAPDLRSLQQARGLVANGDDYNNAVFILSARQQGFTGKIVAMVRHPNRRSPMMRAGADVVFTPTHILAAAIAAKASTRISPRVSGVQRLGRHLEIAEVRIHRTSTLADKTLAETGVGAKTGATVIGQWMGGVLVPQPDARTPMPVDSILIVVGSNDSINKLGQLATPVATTGPFLVMGYGEVGQKVCELLLAAGEKVVVVDINDRPGVDVVGDPLDHQLLEEKAGISEAQAVVLALEDDAMTLFVAAGTRALAPELTIVAGVQRADSIARIHRAGADFALSVGQVADQLLGYQLFGEESISIQPQIKVVRTLPGVLAGAAVISSRVRERTGCSIVAVERGDEVIVKFNEDLTLAEHDHVYISGTPAAIDKYYEAFPGSRDQVR